MRRRWTWLLAMDDRLTFNDYHPEIRNTLKQLANKYPAQTIADAAQTLANLITQHPKPGDNK